MRRTNLAFNHTDPAPWRARQLNELAGRVVLAERDIDKLEAAVQAIDPSAPVGETPEQDPGDLILWYENGKA